MLFSSKSVLSDPLSLPRSGDLEIGIRTLYMDAYHCLHNDIAGYTLDS